MSAAPSSGPERPATRGRGNALLVHGPAGSPVTVAALVEGLRQARAGRRVAVLAPEPALTRLLGWTGPAADSPGPRTVAVTSTVRTPGELWVDVLDPRATMRRLVREHTPDEATAGELLGNPVYRSLEASRAAAQFTAVEQWRALHERAAWDVVMVAAPPGDRPGDVVDAPERFAGFFDNPFFRAASVRHGPLARATDAAASVLSRAVRRLAGRQAVDDALSFLRALAEMEAGLRQRASLSADLLASGVAAHVVVTGPEAAAVDDAATILGAVRERGHSLHALVVDGLHPPPPPLPSRDRDVLAGQPSGPLADHLGWYVELTGRAAAERARVDRLVGHAAPPGVGDQGPEAGRRLTLVELPSSGAGIDGPAALGELAERAIVRDVGAGAGRSSHPGCPEDPSARSGSASRSK